ncbi:MAG: hypothetical protein QW521_03400 [Desulfurococcaceae archaeon]
MAQVIRPEVVRDYAIATGVEGVGMYAFDRVYREALKNSTYVDFVYKTLKPWDKVVLGWGISFAVYVTTARMAPELALRAVRAIGSFAIYSLLKVVVDKEPYIYAKTTEIEVWNLDGGKPVEIWVDEVKRTETAVTDANGYAKISLTTPLEKKSTKFLLHTGFKSVTAEQAVVE